MGLKGLHVSDHLHELVVCDSERTLCQECRIPSILLGKGAPLGHGKHTPRRLARIYDRHLTARTSIGHELQLIDIGDRGRGSRRRLLRLD
jgi:hypothetical protein